VETKNGVRDATAPSGSRPVRSKNVLVRVKEQVVSHNVSLVAAGVAFYVFLAVFPAIAALVSLYGLLNDPPDIQRHMSSLVGLMPPQALSLLEDQLSRMAEAQYTLGLGFVLGIALAVWGASRGMKALITALNIIYGVTERRSLIRFNVVSLFFSVCAIAFVLIALGAIIAFPIALRAIGLPAPSPVGAGLLRWIPLGVFVMIGLALLYRFAPQRKNATFRWVSWGSVAAAFLWLVASAAFSLYITYFGTYNATYGSLGAAIILLLWFYLSAYAVLLGGVLNSQMEGHDATNLTA
jgi:membrane protein